MLEYYTTGNREKPVKNDFRNRIHEDTPRPGSEGGGSVLRAQYAGASKGRHTSPAGMVNP